MKKQEIKMNSGSDMLFKVNVHGMERMWTQNIRREADNQLALKKGDSFVNISWLKEMEHDREFHFIVHM